MPKFGTFEGGRKESSPIDLFVKTFIADFRSDLMEIGIDPSDLGDRNLIKNVAMRYASDPKIRTADVEDLGEKAEAVLTLLKQSGGPRGPEPAAPAAMKAKKPRANRDEETHEGRLAA